jgi:hypothetical protein
MLACVDPESVAVLVRASVVAVSIAMGSVSCEISRCISLLLIGVSERVYVYGACALTRSSRMGDRWLIGFVGRTLLASWMGQRQVLLVVVLEVSGLCASFGGEGRS